MNLQPDYGRLVQCIRNLKIHTLPEFSTYEGTLVRTCGQAYQTLVDGQLGSMRDYNQLITFCDGMRHRLAEAFNNAIYDWSYLKTFVNHRFTDAAFERVRQEFPNLFQEDERPVDLLDNAEKMMKHASQWRIQFQNQIDSLNIVEELPLEEYEEEEEEEDESKWARVHPFDVELLRRPRREQVGPLLPSKYNPITWLAKVRKLLYHVCRVVIQMRLLFDFTKDQLDLHSKCIPLSEFLYRMKAYLEKFRKPLSETAEVFYHDYLKWFNRLRQVVETDPQNEQLIRLTHCTDTYRNNMNDLDLIYFTDDEIYVKPPTLYMFPHY